MTIEGTGVANVRPSGPSPFKENFGMGIKGYAKKRRLEVAAQQLRTTDVPIKGIAIDAGYHHVGNFTRSFLKPGTKP